MRKYFSFFHSTSDYATWLETQNSKEAKVFLFPRRSLVLYRLGGYLRERNFDPEIHFSNCAMMSSTTSFNSIHWKPIEMRRSSPDRYYTIDQHAYWVFLIYIHGAPWKHFNNALRAREIICDVSNYTVDIYVHLSSEACYAIDQLAENRRVINHFKTLRGERTFKQFFHINSQDHQAQWHFIRTYFVAYFLS